MTVGVGFTLQAESEFFERCLPLVDEVDYLEVAPETTWFARGDELHENGFWTRFLELGRSRQKPFVAHGVGLSMGSASARDESRRRKWLHRMRKDQASFQYQWWTDHLGASALDGLAVTLPVPLMMNEETAARIRATLRAMRRVVPEVGLENSVSYFLAGPVLDEPAFINRSIGSSGWLVLDLHNVFTMAQNFKVAPEDYLARLDLRRVIEIHLSGGSESDPAWLPGGKTLRLDSHDHAVPEPVWDLFASTWKKCVHLRGVTLERMEGTVGDDDLPVLRDELRRIRKVLS
jgi:hypothetical protein